MAPPPADDDVDDERPAPNVQIPNVPPQPGRSPAFNAGWRMAEQLGAGRLAPQAFDRAINGRIEQVYHDGVLIAERRVPNDKLLMWLLARLDPKRFALPWEQHGDADPQSEAAGAFSGMLDSLSDTPN